ncbi:hypothetical protein RV16_GL001446 [Enterococcus saccharolyticus]|nr:hypothetical protein RV16_GL001446 [Enterococcus saccharolyticus]
MKEKRGVNMKSLRELFPNDDIYQAVQQTEVAVLAFSFKNAGPLSLTTSKAGGVGYFSKELAYPTNLAGQPLSLLAQINFEEMPHLAKYPKKGILAFYIDLFDDLLGLDFDNPTNNKGFRVVYFEDITKESYTREEMDDIFAEFPKEDDYCVVNGEFQMLGTIEPRYLVTDSYSFEKVYGTHFYEYMETHFGDAADDVSDAIYENLAIAGSLMGGYPFFTQEDPRNYAENVTHTELLFQLDTDEIGIMWGDSGVGNFFISKEDLANRNFTNVLYNWDCY